MAVGAKKARDADRDRAIDLVKSAWVEGQITDDDRDQRVEKLLAAVTVSQIGRLVADLQPTRDRTPHPTRSTPPPLAPATQTRRPNWQAAAAAALAMMAAVFISWQLTSRDDSSSFAEPATPPISWSQENVTALTEALIEERGSAVLFTANFADYGAMVGVPIAVNTQKMRYLRWDGRELTEAWGSQSDRQRFNLSDVDPAILERLVHQAESLIDDPVESSVSVEIRESSEGPEQWYHATAKSDYSEYGYVHADRQGRVLSTSVD